MGGTRRSGFFAGLGRSVSSVVPTGVSWYAFPPRVVVHFSGALQAASLDVSSWFVRRTGQRWDLGSATASGSDVTVGQGGVVSQAGVDEVTYDGVAGDLRDASGDLVRPFTV